jgi:hypothetical protein
MVSSAGLSSRRKWLSHLIVRHQPVSLSSELLKSHPSSFLFFPFVLLIRYMMDQLNLQVHLFIQSVKCIYSFSLFSRSWTPS